MKRRSRYVRAGPTIPMKLVSRDSAILATVGLLRHARAWHIHELHFHGRTLKVCQVRLQKLWSNGYVDRLFQPMVLVEGRTQHRSATPVYQLTAKGTGVTRKAAGKARRVLDTPSPYRLTHDLLVTDAHVAVTVATREHLDGLSVFWWDEREVRQRLRRHVGRESLVVPDAVFSLSSLRDNGAVAFFLEIDTGSEPLVRSRAGTSIAGKLTAYAALHKSSALAKVTGTSAVRVVFVTTSVARADHLLELVDQLPVPPGLFLVTTTEAAVPGVVPGPTLRPQKILEPLFRCARCSHWHSLLEPSNSAS